MMPYKSAWSNYHCDHSFATSGKCVLSQTNSEVRAAHPSWGAQKVIVCQRHLRHLQEHKHCALHGFARSPSERTAHSLAHKRGRRSLTYCIRQFQEYVCLTASHSWPMAIQNCSSKKFKKAIPTCWETFFLKKHVHGSRSLWADNQKTSEENYRLGKGNPTRQ